MADIKDFNKVECQICGAKAHFLELHLTKEHGITVADYQDKHPGAPVLSTVAQRKLAEMEAQVRENRKVKFDIAKAFGIKAIGAVKETTGWERPFPTTPKIDPDYCFDREVVAICLYSLESGDNVLFSGPTGSGKTSCFVQLAARINYPVTRINCDSDLTRGDFVGEKELDGEKTYFRHGLLPRAMKEGHLLILDEWDCANPSVAMLLQAVLEGEPLVITETGEVIERHPDFRIWATSNTLGQGDDTGLYNGTQPQNYAQLDRFGMVKVIGYPKAEQEKKILRKKTGIEDDEVIKKFIEYARLIREAHVKEECLGTMSTRTIVNIATKFVAFGDIKLAYEIGFINKLTGEDNKFAREILQRVWG